MLGKYQPINGRYLVVYNKPDVSDIFQLCLLLALDTKWWRSYWTTRYVCFDFISSWLEYWLANTIIRDKWSKGISQNGVNKLFVELFWIYAGDIQVLIITPSKFETISFEIPLKRLRWYTQ